MRDYDPYDLKEPQSYEIGNLYVHSVKAYTYVPEDRIPYYSNNTVNLKHTSGCNGTLIVTFNWGFQSPKVEAHFPLVSAWLNPAITDSLMTCKVHAEIPEKTRNMTLETQRAIKLASMIRQSPERFLALHCATPEHTLAVYPFGNVLRYGARHTPFTNTGRTSGEHSSMPIFDCKAEALLATVDALKGYAGVIAGLDLVNLNAVSDEILTELGFTMIPDQLGVGVPMFMGDPNNLLTLGRNRYADLSYWDRQKQQQNVSKEVAESFLDLLELELSV